jgi:ribosomal protein L37AE/L43A
MSKDELCPSAGGFGYTFSKAVRDAVKEVNKKQPKKSGCSVKLHPSNVEDTDEN